MGHSHSHGGHHHEPASYDRSFALGVGLNLGFVVVQFAFGVLAASLALVADAGHNLQDVFSLLLAWGASALGRQAVSARRTYGYKRSSILAALFNAGLLLLVSAVIALEAVKRFWEPQPVMGQTVVWVALLGIVVNAGSALLFLRGSKEDLNLRGAFLHLMADAAVSLGVVVSGVLILLTGWLWIDPLMSLLIVGVIVWSTWGLARESLDLALDAVPRGIDPQQVRAYLVGLPSVRGVHDLHIWGLSTTEPALTAHLVLEDLSASNSLIQLARRDLHDRFGIEHLTLQLESAQDPLNCPACEIKSS